MKPGESLEKKSNFALHGFSRYLTSNMALQKIILTSFFYAEQLRCSAYWVCFDDRTIWVFCDFFTPKRFEPRPSFFIMSKYRNSRPDSKNFKFFSPPVFQIIDSKHGSPEDYSDFFFMLNNYVVQHIGSASMTARFGSFAIFLLLNDSSHDPHFSACQNIETLDGIQKISNFPSAGFPDN